MPSNNNQQQLILPPNFSSPSRPSRPSRPPQLMLPPTLFSPSRRRRRRQRPGPYNRARFTNTVNCTICLSPPNSAVVTPCGHTFCHRCLSNWTQRSLTCPVCRAGIHPIPTQRR
ncbi:hypothetical protein Glove_151g159 [Diversispora epigaea]|uniref:RING-type domain-containing protein n=1 Tax=Diversispora epigaea TaxID=1348612 RepID=A0A397IZC7_9GLOM|nr:hypothetical protein Glove_151g159 [Diversispora epigaea]